jgi:hypothetical protein
MSEAPHHQPTPPYMPGPAAQQPAPYAQQQPGAYPPPGQPAQPGRLPQPKANWKLIIAGVAGLLVAMLLVFAAVALLGGAGGKADDVTISNCSGQGDVEVTVTNSSNSRRSYIVRVEVTWIGRRMGTGVIAVPDVAPGQTVRQSRTVPVEGKGDKCAVIDVD